MTQMAASSEANPSYKPHPQLSSPLLYIHNAPVNVTEHVLLAMLNNVASIKFHRKSHSARRRAKNRGDYSGPLVHIVFTSVKAAEKALATNHNRLIPAVQPLATLELSTSPTPAPPSLSSELSVSGWYIKGVPKYFTDGELYDLLRPFGPLAFVENDPDHNARAEFWNKDDACEAQKKARIRGSKIIFHAYNPVRLYCKNLPLHANELYLRDLFKEYTATKYIPFIVWLDKISSQSSVTVRTSVNGRQKLGFVTFKTREEASEAMANFQDCPLGEKAMRIEYSFLKTPKKTSDASSELPPEVTNTTQHQSTTPTAKNTQPNTENAQDNASNIADPNESAKHWKNVALRYAVELNQAKQENELLCKEIKELTRQLELSESRRKILELDRDRPLWEAAQREREAREAREAAQAEAQKREAEVEESKRRMQELAEQERVRKAAELEEKRRREAERQAQKDREESARKAREEEERREKARKRQEEQARMKQWKLATEQEERRCKRRDQLNWGSVYWTARYSFQRFKMVSDEFDLIKFTKDKPLTCGSVPWPIHLDPALFPGKDLLDILDWSAVEGFFREVRDEMGWSIHDEEYKRLIERAHRMFHPDRWKSRGLLETVFDEGLRKRMEEAGNVVAQALTPLWRQSRGYS